jgi:acyl carrier protein
MTAEPQAGQASGALRQRVIDSITGLLPHVARGVRCEVTEDTRLMEDLELTSTSTLELMLEVEEDLAIQIDVEDIQPADVASIGALADFIAAHALVMG